MKVDEQTAMRDIYNLILNPATRVWERTQLLTMKNAVEKGAHFNTELDQLEFALRPLAWRDNLTPDVADFYAKITDDAEKSSPFDVAKHQNLSNPYYERAIFAGGCFWCMVEPFETRPGIVSVLSGYTGGNVNQPTYEQVVGQQTGHVEAVEIVFDTRIIKYNELVAWPFIGKLQTLLTIWARLTIAVRNTAQLFSFKALSNEKLRKLPNKN